MDFSFFLHARSHRSLDIFEPIFEPLQHEHKACGGSEEVDLASGRNGDQQGLLEGAVGRLRDLLFRTVEGLDGVPGEPTSD